MLPIFEHVNKRTTSTSNYNILVKAEALHIKNSPRGNAKLWAVLTCPSNALCHNDLVTLLKGVFQFFYKY